MLCCFTAFLYTCSIVVLVLYCTSFLLCSCSIIVLYVVPGGTNLKGKVVLQFGRLWLYPSLNFGSEQHQYGVIHERSMKTGQNNTHKQTTQDMNKTLLSGK